MTNASGIEKLRNLANETGAKPVSKKEVVKGVDVLIISIPFIEIPNLAKEIKYSISNDTIVIDTTNYYPIRDGKIEEIENGMLESVWVSNHINQPVVKVYNSVLSGSLALAGLPKGTNNRIALPISGDNESSKKIVATLVNDSGFDALDIGNIANSWKQQPGSQIYCTDLNLSQLKNNNEKVDRETLPERRELALLFILKQDPLQWVNWWKDCVTNNRMVYKTELNN